MEFNSLPKRYSANNEASKPNDPLETWEAFIPVRKAMNFLLEKRKGSQKCMSLVWSFHCEFSWNLLFKTQKRKDCARHHMASCGRLRFRRFYRSSKPVLNCRVTKREIFAERSSVALRKSEALRPYGREIPFSSVLTTPRTERRECVRGLSWLKQRPSGRFAD